MRVKPYLFGCILLSILAAAEIMPASAATTAAPAPAGNKKMVDWRSIPEDSTPWRREPFKKAESAKSIHTPSLNPASTAADFTLQGIMKSNKHYYAIVNGRSVKAGDHIDGWTVSTIDRYRLTLRRENEKQHYDIYQGRIDRGTR